MAPTKSWTPDEDQALRDYVYLHGGKQWRGAVSHIGKSIQDCQQRWKLLCQTSMGKQPWTNAEDQAMLRLVRRLGPHKWGVIASYFPCRSGKQCRERWCNQLDPSVSKGAWTSQEDEVLVALQVKHGNRWSLMAETLPGRTDNAVKNHWHASVKKAKRETPPTLPPKEEAAARPLLAKSSPALEEIWNLQDVDLSADTCWMEPDTIWDNVVAINSEAPDALDDNHHVEWLSSFDIFQSGAGHFLA